NVVFFNADYLKARVLEKVGQAVTPVEWVVIDANSINVMDFTAIQKVDELREDLAARGISLRFAHVKRSLGKFFSPHWLAHRGESRAAASYPNLTSAVEAFMDRPPQAPAPGREAP